MKPPSAPPSRSVPSMRDRFETQNEYAEFASDALRQAEQALELNDEAYATFILRQGEILSNLALAYQTWRSGGHD